MTKAEERALTALAALVEALEVGEGQAEFVGGKQFVPRPVAEQVEARAAIDGLRSPESVEGYR